MLESQFSRMVAHEGTRTIVCARQVRTVTRKERKSAKSRIENSLNAKMFQKKSVNSFKLPSCHSCGYSASSAFGAGADSAGNSAVGHQQQ